MRSLDLVLALVDVLVVPGAAVAAFAVVIAKARKEAEQRWKAPNGGSAAA